ncbi:MAG: hypothetical protein IPK16_07040 [Anaerolineales bacterium]|nr:hypothetical protein [Anaerolineales bacterium]
MNTRFRVKSLISLALLGYLLLLPLRAATAQDLPDGNQPLAPAAVDAALAAGFKYQGQLQKSGAPYAGRCAMQFRLWTTSTGGTQVGPTLSFSNVNVSAGAFAVTLNFGNGIFTGDARWLGTSVQCTGDATFTELAPRQVISAVPYAIGLRPGAIIRDSSNTGGDALYVEKNVFPRKAPAQRSTVRPPA